MPSPRRFEAPTGNGEVFANPAFDRVPELVERNRKLLDRTDVVIGGLPLRELRKHARREVFESPGIAIPGLSADAPLLVAGHQPEFSHPGVWVKHFALAGLANRLRGVSLNLVVDNDTLKSTSLRAPVFDPDPARVHLESVPFDQFHAEEPYEDRRVHDPETLRTFAERVVPLCRNWGFEPLLFRVWPEVAAHTAETIGKRFASVRHEWECRWGCFNIDLSVSALVRSESFTRFVSHIAADGERFRECYNGAVHAYRAANGIESQNHPVPDLAPGELPFWYRKASAGRRERLMTGRPITRGFVRPRALTLTLFARLIIGDFFIHGIGGGKYDEVTDAIIRDYFGIEPPAYQVLSATLHLPLPNFPASNTDVKRLERLERDLYWNPHRHLPDVGPVGDEHTSLEASAPEGHAARKERFLTFRRIGDELRPRVADQLAEARQRLDRARQEARANAILRRRDYSWVLFPEDVLKPFLQRFLEV
jgi:hypothetical protein